ncbi:hypothetical protein L227DRAFT_148811 [Lentinus tigrinus ALCF2SS1-6]|uniref:Uncharacterized protein n=1 Tax=Lentinus tigrinus ALCF2SS1-6 TaxID=1328759 RepID=A0A5C2T290_9APHY|nr:hypothetical protein L227DRAFT_148811 [Lentinus tigrinus ALCF2SS1-6]
MHGHSPCTLYRGDRLLCWITPSQDAGSLVSVSARRPYSHVHFTLLSLMVLQVTRVSIGRQQYIDGQLQRNLLPAHKDRRTYHGRPCLCTHRRGAPVSALPNASQEVPSLPLPANPRASNGKPCPYTDERTPRCSRTSASRTVVRAVCHPLPHTCSCS